ncbi:MAG: DUF502 domain-containing protein [Planctomycetota bacterium]|nr:DUF502 domain-containing protein [Planctomycetota bacterium]
MPPPRRRLSFFDDFRRFFVRGLAAVLPTLITLSLLFWAWNFLWDHIGIYIVWLIRDTWYEGIVHGYLHFQTQDYIIYHWNYDDFGTRLVGVLLSILLVYIIGVFVGNLIGRTAWRLAERAVLRIPLVSAIYPAVKQITDFVLSDRSRQFKGSRVVAVQPHEQNIWSIGLVTSVGQWQLSDAGPTTMVTVFIPSTPTSFSGYLLVVPRNKVVELPMTVEEAFRLLLSGGVITPGPGKTTGREMRPDATTPSTDDLPNTWGGGAEPAVLSDSMADQPPNLAVSESGQQHRAI